MLAAGVRALLLVGVILAVMPVDSRSTTKVVEFPPIPNPIIVRAVILEVTTIPIALPRENRVFRNPLHASGVRDTVPHPIGACLAQIRMHVLATYSGAAQEYRDGLARNCFLENSSGTWEELQPLSPLLERMQRFYREKFAVAVTIPTSPQR